MKDSIIVGAIALFLFFLFEPATKHIPAVYHPLAINALLVGITIALFNQAFGEFSFPGIAMGAFSMGWFGFGLGVAEHACPAGLTLALGTAILLSLPLAKMLFNFNGPDHYFRPGGGVTITLMRGVGVNLLVISTILGILFG